MNQIQKLLLQRFKDSFIPKKGYIHICRICGPFVRGYSEIWEKGASEPFKIEFFQYNNGIKDVIEEILIGKDENKKIMMTTNYCGVCNSMLNDVRLTKDKYLGSLDKQNDNAI